ncbi:MAG: RteC domain-containing protein [Tannerellaceae bacterium]|jgi:hypothetical protein|nr:RteC domain-containing protein [Tannerellaceae bacterium]
MLVEAQIELAKCMLQAQKARLVEPEKKRVTGIRWTGSLVQLVELVYSFYVAKCFNNGTIALKDLFRFIGKMFDFKVADFSRTFSDIKNRTNERTKFLNELKCRLTEYMEAFDK